MTAAEKVRVMQVLDLLDRADQAFKAKHLTSPRGNNALEYYQQVLRIIPGYQEAEQGIDRIAERYLHWAEAAIAEGRTGAARNYLTKSRQINPDSTELKRVQQRLKSAKPVVVSAPPAKAPDPKVEPADVDPQSARIAGSDNRYIQLQPQALKSRSPAMKALLAQLADRIQAEQARVIIEAPSDPQGRWIYQQLNQRHEEYRIRANLRLASKPAIRLLPR
ncbi:hypothetical protein DV711_13785 [Motiliproteus coralliicola]|uniref:Tetratricopeptide repeat protein n=2 Tax=Motiliproteus coralliicola TaxID=2283196 RepID=A0A369WF58_9GAMM|nr:hypothetical protein DV711_13785 [Motiliproteus coralliicola]